MERSGSSSASPPSNIISHILETLKDGYMGLVGADLFMMAHKWVGSPIGWVEYPGTYFALGSMKVQ
jgi:hypothetical protein